MFSPVADVPIRAVWKDLPGSLPADRRVKRHRHLATNGKAKGNASYIYTLRKPQGAYASADLGFPPDANFDRVQCLIDHAAPSQ